jgi:hypothetical protein
MLLSGNDANATATQIDGSTGPVDAVLMLDGPVINVDLDWIAHLSSAFRLGAKCRRLRIQYILDLAHKILHRTGLRKHGGFEERIAIETVREERASWRFEGARTGESGVNISALRPHWGLWRSQS